MIKLNPEDCSSLFVSYSFTFAKILNTAPLYKQLAALLILVAFLAQNFNKVFILADYYANTQAFAKNCENTDKPEMHCNGKCQMMKKMKAEDKKDQQAPERKVQNEITLSSKSFFATIPHFENTSNELIYPELQSPKEIKMPHTIFHPPTA